MPPVCANQNAERPVRTRPLSGISVGRTTSNVEIRSLATSSSRSSSIVNSSRTFPLATWTSVSDMSLLSRQVVEPLEGGVEVARVRAVVECLADVDASGDPRVRLDERAEVEPFVPCAERVLLDEAVRLVARQAALDE